MNNRLARLRERHSSTVLGHVEDSVSSPDETWRRSWPPSFRAAFAPGSTMALTPTFSDLLSEHHQRGARYPLTPCASGPGAGGSLPFQIIPCPAGVMAKVPAGMTWRKSGPETANRWASRGASLSRSAVLGLLAGAAATTPGTCWRHWLVADPRPGTSLVTQFVATFIYSNECYRDPMLLGPFGRS